MTNHLGYGINQWLCGVGDKYMNGVNIKKMKFASKRLLIACNGWAMNCKDTDESGSHDAVSGSSLENLLKAPKYGTEVGIAKHGKAPVLFIAGNVQALSARQSYNRYNLTGLYYYDLPWGISWNSTAQKYELIVNPRDPRDL